MRVRWIHSTSIVLAAVRCGAAAVTTTQPAASRPAVIAPRGATTLPVSTHAQPTERHEPVAPPPPPPQAPVVIIQTPVTTTKSPTTQPAATLVVPVVVPTTQPGPIDDRVAYAFGYSAGRRIRDRLEEDGRSADDLLVIKGLVDGLGDREAAYPRQEVQAAFAEFQAYTLQRRAEKMYADNPAFRKHADENLRKSRAILDQNAEMAGVQVLPDGVQVLTLAPGTGRIVGNAKTLTLKNLHISLVDGTLVKASDADQTEQLAAADALPALMNAIRGMKTGSKTRIWLPPDKAYGLTGKPPVVGPNQGIEYEFELVDAQ